MEEWKEQSSLAVANELYITDTNLNFDHLHLKVSWNADAKTLKTNIAYASNGYSGG
jgi:hypothetical protein